MASTKKKRRTKHRGNAAGIVETRGRTGRNRPVADTKKQRSTSRMERFNRPPSWKSAAQRAAIAVGIFVVVVVVAFHQKPAPAILLGGFMLLVYTPMGFYMDSFFYKRRQAQAAKHQKR
jgi:hypothetical protein